MKYISYFNTFLIVMIIIVFMGFFKYFFNNEKDYLEDNFEYKFLKKNKFKHVLFIPDIYFFIQNKKIYNSEDPYLLYMNKIFDFVNEALKLNIEILTIDFTSDFYISLLWYKDLNKIFNPKLWNELFKFAKKMNIKLNFIYNKSSLYPEFISLLENIKSKNNEDKNNKCLMEVNFLIGYNIMEDIKDNIIDIVGEFNKKLIYNENNLRDYLSTKKIKKIMYKKCKPFDIVYICANASMVDSALLYFNHAKIINLNYSFDDLSQKVIKNLLINTIFNNNLSVL